MKIVYFPKSTHMKRPAAGVRSLPRKDIVFCSVCAMNIQVGKILFCALLALLLYTQYSIYKDLLYILTKKLLQREHRNAHYRESTLKEYFFFFVRIPEHKGLQNKYIHTANIYVALSLSLALVHL